MSLTEKFRCAECLRNLLNSDSPGCSSFATLDSLEAHIDEAHERVTFCDCLHCRRSPRDPSALTCDRAHRSNGGVRLWTPSNLAFECHERILLQSLALSFDKLPRAGPSKSQANLPSCRQTDFRQPGKLTPRSERVKRTLSSARYERAYNVQAQEHRHRMMEEFTCRLCKKMVADWKRWDQHICQSHLGVHPYECSHKGCGFKTALRAQARLHGHRNFVMDHTLPLKPLLSRYRVACFNWNGAMAGTMAKVGQAGFIQQPSGVAVADLEVQIKRSIELSRHEMKAALTKFRSGGALLFENGSCVLAPFSTRQNGDTLDKDPPSRQAAAVKDKAKSSGNSCTEAAQGSKQRVFIRRRQNTVRWKRTAPAISGKLPTGRPGTTSHPLTLSASRVPVVPQDPAASMTNRSSAVTTALTSSAGAVTRCFVPDIESHQLRLQQQHSLHMQVDGSDLKYACADGKVFLAASCKMCPCQKIPWSNRELHICKVHLKMYPFSCLLCKGVGFMTAAEVQLHCQRNGHFAAAVIDNSATVMPLIKQMLDKCFGKQQNPPPDLPRECPPEDPTDEREARLTAHLPADTKLTHYFIQLAPLYVVIKQLTDPSRQRRGSQMWRSSIFLSNAYACIWHVMVLCVCDSERRPASDGLTLTDMFHMTMKDFYYGFDKLRLKETLKSTVRDCVKLRLLTLTFQINDTAHFRLNNDLDWLATALLDGHPERLLKGLLLAEIGRRRGKPCFSGPRIVEEALNVGNCARCGGDGCVAAEVICDDSVAGFSMRRRCLRFECSGEAPRPQALLDHPQPQPMTNPENAEKRSAFELAIKAEESDVYGSSIMEQL